jgi:hypothetical protein
MGMNPRLLRPTPTGFDPRSITGLNLWIDFADTAAVTLDGSNKISAVLDKSGNGLDGSQTTAGNRLGVSTLNGRACADGGTASHAFSVGRSGSGNNWRDGYVAAVWDSDNSTFPDFNSFFSALGATGTNAGAAITGNSGSNSFFIDGGIWNNSTTALRLINNTSATGNGAMAPFPAFRSPFVFRGVAGSDVSHGGWAIGGDRSFAGRGWRGRIGEVVIFNRQLNTQEALAVRRYLASKWGAPTQT